MIGNTNLTPVNYSDTADNAFTMEYVDIDGDNSTFNSSSSLLEFSTENGANPECSSIVFAGLYWTGRAAQDGPDNDLDGDGNPNTFTVTKNGVTKNFDKTKVLFKGPNSSYEQITATEIQFPDGLYNNMYASYADVTQIVSDNGGIGEYTVADIATTEGQANPYGYYGGWGLVVVYQNIDMKWRDVTVFDGYAYVESAGGENFIDVNGFKAVQTGDVNIKLGLMAGEGDVGFDGDKFSIIVPDGNDDKNILTTLDDNTYRDLQHTGNTTNNFFNSSIYTHNGVTGKRTPDLSNNTGVDIAVFNIENTDKSLITNGQDYTRFRYNSTRDTYIIFNATFSVDAYIPEPQGLLSVTTLNGSEPSDVNTSLEPSESADFLIEIKNAGTEATDNTKLTIPLPDSIDPENLKVETTTHSSVTNTTPYTIDNSIGTNGAIVWNIGTLPVPPNPEDTLATISFSITVTTDCTFYADDEEQTVSVNGYITGMGAVSEAPFNIILFQGYEEDGDCAGALIAAPIIIPIEYEDYVSSPPTGTAPENVTIQCGEEIPVADISTVTNLSDNSGVTPSVAFVEDVSDNGSPEIITRTYSITDDCENVVYVTQEITVMPEPAPEAICQNISIFLDASGNATITPDQIDNGSSSCSGDVILTATPLDFDCSNIGDNTVTLTVTNESGASTTCEAIVNVSDNINPTAICQDATIQLDADGNATLDANLVDNGSTDNCGIQSIEVDKTAFTCADLGTNTVTLTVTDNSNNVSTCSATVTVEDVTAPNVICKDITVELDSSGNANITADDIDNGSNDACSTVSLSASKTNFDCSNLGENIVTLTATDSAGNESFCDATVTVEDTTAPTISCQNITVTLDASGNASILPNDIDGGSSDCSGAVTLSISQADFDCSNIGDNIVTLTVTDSTGNESSCDATVTVEDNIAPTITCPADIVVSADPGQCTASNVDLGTPTTDDNCGVESVLNDSLEPYALGETIVTWTVTDSSGNTTTCTQKVTVTDGNLPEVTCPAPMSVFVDEDSCSASNIELGTLDIEDCTSVDVVNNAPETFPIGDTEVTWTVTDSEGNQTSCVQIITVIDNIAPTFVETLPVDSLTVECNAVPDAETLTATDNCGEATVTFTEDITNGSCDNNYIIERTWTATDAYDLTTIFTQIITVQDTTAPTFIGELPNNILVVECDAIPTPETLTAEDTCGTATVTSEDIITLGNCPSNYTISRVWTAEDECENKTLYTQIITVQDTTAPVFDEPLPAETIEVECDAIPDADLLTATDNCGNVTIEMTDTRTDGDCPSNYTISRTWIATDECGLETSFTQTISVVDTTAPTPTTSFESELNVSCTEIPEAPVVEFTDNCSDNITIEYNEVSTFDESVLEDYQITRSWTVTDLCSNTETYTQTLNVALDEIYTNIVAPDWCYKEGIVDLNEFIDDSLNTNGTWEILEGDLQATLTNNIFDPSVLVLSEDFLPNDGGIDYLFRYTTTNEGCLSTTEVTMNIHADCDVLPCGETDISISTAVTPNGDGINDTFDISGIDLCGFVANVKIFNRWGALVYESDNYTLGSMSTTGSQGDWDGYSPKSSIGNNGNLPNGTYYYIIQLKDSGLQPLTGPIYLGTK